MSANRFFPAAPALFLASLLFAGLAPAASAQQSPEAVREVARGFLEAQAAGLPGTVEIKMGEVDARSQLPACAAMEAFLPAGTRAWGRISVGVRCDSPVTWTVYVPAQVSVVTDYLVTARPIRPGQIVGPEDLSVRQGDLAAQPANILTDMSQAVGLHARVAVAAGNPLRADMLRIPAAVRQGQTVKVTSAGSVGFRVTTEGRALNAAAEGEPVRVRLPGGQVLSGTARNGGIVEVQF